MMAVPLPPVARRPALVSTSARRQNSRRELHRLTISRWSRPRFGGAGVSVRTTVAQMPTWIAPVFTLVGVAAGWSLNILGDALRERQATRRRWDDLRRQLAIQFLDATDQVGRWANVATNISSFEKSGVGFEFDGVSDRRVALAKISEADKQVRDLYIEIQLIGSDAERQAAALVRDATWKSATGYAAFQAADAAERAAKQREFETADGNCRVARDAYLETVRNELLPDERKVSLRRR